MAKRTAQTAPRGAIVIEIPFLTKIWSILPNTAMAANAPADGQKMSLSEGALEAMSGFQASQLGAAKFPAALIPINGLLLLLESIDVPAIPNGNRNRNRNRNAWLFCFRIFTSLEIYEVEEEENVAIE